MLNVTPFRQRPANCGPASLKMVLGYYGIKVSERTLARKARTSLLHGTRGSALVKVAQSYGFNARIIDNTSFSVIERFLHKGVPVIVNWFSHDEGHYSVVVGLDKQYIYLQDPDIGKIRKLSLEVFKRVWFDFRGPYIKDKRSLVLRRIIVVERK